MGACVSKSMALKEDESAPVTPEEPPEISMTSEAEQEQKEVKQIVDAAKEPEVAGGRDDEENNRKSLGVLLSEIEHPATTTGNATIIAEVEARGEDQPEAVDSMEKSAAIAEQSMEKVESETETLVAELSTTKKDQPGKDQSISKVEFNASPPQISQNKMEEQSVDLVAKPAEQSVEIVESETGSAVAETSKKVNEQSERDLLVEEAVSETVMERSERDQFVEMAEVNVSALQISHEEEEQSKAVDLVVKSAVAANQPEDKVESVSDTETAEISKAVMDQSEQDRFVENAEVIVSATQISLGEEEQSKAVDSVKSALVAKQPVDKVVSVSDTETDEIPTAFIEQALEKIEQKEGDRSIAEEPANKF